ncbi:hypothetical protein [Rhodococcus opacus]
MGAEDVADLGWCGEEESRRRLAWLSGCPVNALPYDELLANGSVV